MNDIRQALIAAVLADPDDDAPRLIYADWLDERGECDYAEFIREVVRSGVQTPGGAGKAVPLYPLYPLYRSALLYSPGERGKA